MEFKEQDIKQFQHKGISQDLVNKQIDLFVSGLPFSNLIAAATPNDGLLQLSDEEKQKLIEFYQKRLDDISVIKFVPASGAATRMFKFLFRFLQNYDPQKESINSYINKNEDRDLSTFLIGLEKLPFYELGKKRLKEEYPNYEELPDNQQYYLFVKVMLDDDKLNYGNQPKGLLPFHRYKNGAIATAFEEHLYETALYTSDERPVKIHFTISEDFKDKFKNEFKRIEEDVEDHTGSKFNISFSYQKGSTDTLAVTMDDEPFREDDGSILFRPSGHGALIENLNELDADLIFIKNIDNVVVKKYKDEVAENKKVLGGLLLKLQEKVFEIIKNLNRGVSDEDELSPITDFLENEMQMRLSKNFYKYKLKYQVEYLLEKLNRPIRVCGMVKNEGEPGGGPFWVKDEDGNISLQIVESAQIDLNNKKQHNILKNSTHFNPVDVVCGVRDYNGKKFDLKKYVDDDAAFITNKTKAGKSLKALELPGLWNGGMAHWNTVFVEVPIITFNPVKTINDLMKAPHQIK